MPTLGLLGIIMCKIQYLYYILIKIYLIIYLKYFNSLVETVYPRLVLYFRLPTLRWWPGLLSVSYGGEY